MSHSFTSSSSLLFHSKYFLIFLVLVSLTHGLYRSIFSYFQTWGFCSYHLVTCLGLYHIVVREHMYFFVLWNLFRLVLWSWIWSILSNVFCTLEKKVYYALLWTVLTLFRSKVNCFIQIFYILNDILFCCEFFFFLQYNFFLSPTTISLEVIYSFYIPFVITLKISACVLHSANDFFYVDLVANCLPEFSH